MTEQDKLYIKTHREWVKSTDLNVREHLLEVRHNEEKIDLLKLQIEVDTKRAQLSQGYLLAGNAEFVEWCANNNIDPNVEI